MKKIIAFTLSALMLLTVMAGCKDKADPNNPGGSGATDPTDNTGVVGPVFEKGGGTLNMTAGDAAILVTYDANGIVEKVEALSNKALEWMETCDDQTSSTCTELTGKFIKDNFAINMRKLSFVCIKQNKGSGYPTDTFMKDIDTVAKDALSDIGSTAKLVVLSMDKLDSNGYMDAETAGVLAAAWLGAKNVENLSRIGELTNGFYSYLIRYDGEEEAVHVNAETGCSGLGVIDEGPQGAGDDPAEATDPKENTTVPTTPSQG